MNSPLYFQTLCRYNRWMNEKIYEACSGLTDEQRKEDRGAFFKSIHGTLNHLLLADRVWLGRFTGTPFPATSLDQELYADWDELRRERALTDDALDAFVNGLTDKKLTETLHYTSLTGTIPQQRPVWVVLAHVFNHQTHHRGQITALMEQMGCDSGITDLVYLVNDVE